MQTQNVYGYIYFVLIIFIFPLVIITIVYIRIIKYMKKNPFSTTNRCNTTSQRRQQSEFRLIRRILMIVTALCLLGFPKVFSFVAIEIHLIPSWPNIIRIDRMFMTIGQSATMLINLITTDDVKKVLMSIIKKCIIRKNQVQCATLMNKPNRMP